MSAQRLAAVAILACAAADPTAAQNIGQTEAVLYQRAMDAAERATSLLASEGLEAAEPLLIEALESCPVDQRGQACRRVIEYSLGFAYQNEATERKTDREELLRQAADWFRRTLDENPDYEPARRGLALAYRQLGAGEWQERDLVNLAVGDDTGRYAVVLGDYYRDAGRWQEAIDAYRRAMEQAPRSPEPRHRMLSLFRSEEAPIEALAPYLAEWELLFPRLAAEGYRLYMQRAYPADPEEAAGVLPGWLLAREGMNGLGPELVDQVPEDWGALPFASLRGFLLEPASAPIPGWWTATEDRREAIAATALALGTWRLVEAGGAEAERVWRRGLELAPEYGASWIGLTTQLALLYDQQPELDPEGERFAGLEHDLFTGKGQAIGSRDYEAMQRFHTTLGVIYSRRGVWGTPGTPRGAIYQLDHALQAADRQREQTGIHQPLPEVRRRLAEAYLEISDAEAASAQFADAAIAYLEVDDLGGAGAALEAAAPRAEGSVEVRAGREWLGLRRRASAARSGGGCGTPILRAVRQAPGRGLDEDAVVRQRFKALTDCASSTARGGAELAAEALGEVLRTGASLAGLGDLTRLEDARDRVFRTFGQTPEPVSVNHSATRRTEGLVPLSLPDEGGVYVGVGADAALAAAVVMALRPSEEGLGSLRLRIRNGQVAVLDPGSLSLDAVEARLRSVDGVRDVSVRRY